MKKDVVKTLTRNAVVAAIYFILTFAGNSFSFNIIQIRVSEALILLCFFRRDYVYGLTLGCLISNIFSPILPWDLLIGTAATFLSGLLISYSKHLLPATLIPVVINGFAVGGEFAILSKAVFWPTVGFIALGEFIAVSVIGYLLFLLVKRNKSFYATIGANKNTDYIW